ncbi:putative secreted protein (Por secretion system target) [Kordia periserrulae]|uniref:Putative secreted protein (Por secretion system target) n=1 Tax=Kordia periserrulae TaxID=701523 RepID=A0A2T6BWH2_9FLAO|nr:SdrD B-like domain-containing protein [Kordia periserrulae]PTX60413.1 putative secreted protein (Por secretion system target) [Kordia periserrulae]
MKTKITLLVLIALLGLTNVFANSMPTSENVVENEMMTTDGNLIIISAGKRIYKLDMNTYHATLLATSPYVNEINSIASDASTGWIFYVSNHISSYNWTIYGYNVYTNTHKNFGSVRHFFTGTGHAYSSRGLASGGATFYNGKLYFAMEYPVYCYYYRDGRRTSSVNENPKDELNNNPRAATTTSTGMFSTRGTSVSTEEDVVDNGGRDGNGETPADFVIIEAEEANQINDNVSDYIPEEDLPQADSGTSDDNLAQRGNTYQTETTYYYSSYNNNIYLLEISFNGLADTSGQTTSVANGRPVYDNWGYSSFLYKGELGDIVVDDNGQMYAATSYQVQAYNFNSNRYDWANNEDVYAQMAKDKYSNLQLLKNKRQCSTTYYNGCPHTTCTLKSFVQKYTAPAQLRTYNSLQLGSLIEISGLDPHDVGKITDASDYVDLTPPVSYKVKGIVYDDNNEDGNIDAGETATSGITVTLYADNNNDNMLDSGDTVINSQTTDANGAYEFNNIDVAETLVAVTVPNNTPTTTFTSTTPEVVAISGSTNDVIVDFGINEALIPINYDVFGTVYDDNNENATLDGGEAGLENVTLTLYADNNADGLLDSGDTVISTTTSANDGTYSFLHVCVQNTIVAVTVPTNTGDFTYTLTTAGTQAIDSINTDVTGVDFGINEVQVIDYAISGNVYDDNDESGAQDAGEDNLESITVTLYADNNADGAVDAGDTVIGTATTAADGTYSFSNVTVENTVVAVTVPGNTPAFTYTLTTAGSVNTSSTTTDVTGVNFGINEVEVIDYNISGVVFDDDNESGDINPSEGRIENVVVRLYEDVNADGALDANDVQLANRATGANGEYQFENVSKRNTLVEFTVPANSPNFTYVATTPDVVAVSGTINDVTDVNYGVNKEQVIDYNISGTVFDDDNENGTADAGERDLQNITVTLYADTNADGAVDAGDTVIVTATTANDGSYSFSNVTVENTVVEVTVPANTANFTYTLTTAGSIDTSSLITDITGADFGINEVEVILYDISGTVFDDDNGDGIKDATEGFVEAVTVTLYADNNGDGILDAGDTAISTTTSSTTAGDYSFTGVTVRNTIVAVTVPTNTADFTYTLTTADAQAVSSAITNVTDVDFGIDRVLIVDYSIFGTVYDDDNENAILDATETGRLENVTISLYVDEDADGRVGSEDTLITTTTTAADGTYSFLNVTVQNTIVAITVPDNGGGFTYLLTTASSFNLSSVDTDITDVDFGVNRAPANYNISGNVFNDVNADGVNATTEAGLSGVVINLYEDLNQNGRVDRGEPLIATATSDRSGNYNFTGITAPNVIVQMVLPANTPQFTFTPTTPVSVVVTGSTSTTIDFGINRQLVVLYNVSGIVWDDQDADQIKDSTESRLEGVAVTLYEDVNANGALDMVDRSLSTITTSATGFYQFSNVNLQNVLVVPTVPSNGTLTTPNSRAISSINTNAIDVDFGIKIASTLFQVTGVVFNDQNANGIIDAGEESIDGLPVEIYADTDLSGTFDPNLDLLVAFTQTSNSGFGFLNPNYLVDDIPGGQVFIVVIIPEDTIFTTYTPTFDPDSGTANPDGVYPTNLNTNLVDINFGIKVEDANSTSRAANEDDVLFTNGSSIDAAPEDVSERLRLYPNPTVRDIAINADEFAGDVTVEIYNDRGYQVVNTTVSSFGSEYKVDVQRLAPGMYYAKFTSRNKVASKKFIKK